MLDDCGTLPAGQVVAVAALVADALASAHRRGLVHGDVKPANILLTSDGEPLLSDFGAARHLRAPVTSTAPVAGTAPYVDPELLAGASPSSGATCTRSASSATRRSSEPCPMTGRTMRSLVPPTAESTGRCARCRPFLVRWPT